MRIIFQSKLKNLDRNEIDINKSFAVETEQILYFIHIFCIEIKEKI